MFRAHLVQKVKTHFTFNKVPHHPKKASFMRKCGKIWWHQTSRRQFNMAHAQFTMGYLRIQTHTFGICDNDSFSTVMMVVRISQIYSWNEILCVSDSSSVHYQEFFTVHTAMVYVIKVCWQLVSRSKCSWSQAVSKPVWYIPLLCLQWNTPDDGQRNYPKHVEFQSKNKFEKLVHLVGFSTRNLSRCTVTWTSNSA